MPGKIAAGTFSLLLDGVPFDITGEFTVNVSKLSSEPEVGADGHVADIQSNEMPGVEGTIRDSGGLVVADLDGREDISIQVPAANGKTYALEDCKQVLALTVALSNSNIPVKFVSMSRSIKEVNVTG